MPLITPTENPTPVEQAYANFQKQNADFYTYATQFLQAQNGLFWGQINTYSAQDLWNLIGTNGAASLQVLNLLIQALTIANPSYTPPVIPDTLTPNSDGTVTDTPPAPTN